MNMGYSNLRQYSWLRMGVLTDNDRLQTIGHIVNELGESAIHDVNDYKASSVGKILIEDRLSVVVKPLSRQGTSSAGLKNESLLVNGIKEHLPCRICFYDMDKQWRLNNEVITSCEAVGSDTTGRKKADIVLLSDCDNEYRISLKKDNAEIWESADKFYSAKAKGIIEHLVNQRDVSLDFVNDVYRVKPNIAVPATIDEKQHVVFGSDIEPHNGAVVTKTFSSDCGGMQRRGDILYVNCTDITHDLSGIVGTHKDVWFMIRNDRTRNNTGLWPGIRVIAVYEKRLSDRLLILNNDFTVRNRPGMIQR